MSSDFDLRVRGLLLRQGRRLDGVSRLLLALAAFWLVVGTLSVAESLDSLDRTALWLSLVAGAGQLYYAMRVDFDADLMLALADGIAPAMIGGEASPRPGNDEAALLLDSSLRSLGLLGTKGEPRDWAARWRGMRRLFFGQTACLVLQAGLLVLVWIDVSSRSHG